MPKEVILAGQPYERGTRYGSQCREEIRLSIRTYSRRFLEQHQISWEQARTISKRYIDVIAAADEAYMVEMQGIADGAQLDLEDILAINCRSELLYAPVELPPDAQECTAFSLIPPATANQAVIAGQNWDYTRAQRDAVVILRIPAQDGHPDILMFPEAGMIGAMGMNSAGLALTLNALSSPERAHGLPLHIRMRRILEQTTFEAAFCATVAGAQPAPANLILTHRDGIALGFELDPSGFDVLQPRKGMLFHTNHFIGPKFSLRSNGHASTLIRLQRMEALLGDRTDLTTADAIAALKDHAGHPIGVCKHIDPASQTDPMAQSATNFALIMDIKAGTALFAFGNPCESPFATLRVSE